MKKFEVLALTLGGLYNRIFTAGDIVDESCFPAGNCVKLVEQVFLKEVIEEEVIEEEVIEEEVDKKKKK